MIADTPAVSHGRYGVDVPALPASRTQLEHVVHGRRACQLENARMKKIVALVAALALTVPLAGCGQRDRRAGSDSTRQQQQQLTPSGVAPTVDPAGARANLDDLDNLIGNLGGTLASESAESAAADAD
jgi:hypothetical protein